MSGPYRSAVEREVAAGDALNDRPILQKKLLTILHKACSEIRGLIQRGEQQRVYDLADTVEFIPEFMLHWRAESRQSIWTALKEYQEKYRGSGFDYLGLLEMDDEEFSRFYLDTEQVDVS